MSDERTPADLRREVLRARREREEAIRRELETPPEYDGEEEPSKVTIVGPAAEEFVARGGLLARASRSIAPISRKMDSRGGRISAIVTGGVVLLGGVLKLIAWLQENGFLD